MADTSKTEEPTKVPESTDAGAGATAGAGAGAGAGAPAEGAKKKHHGDAEIEDESRVTETPALPKNGKKGPRTVKRRGVARKKKFGKVTLIEYSDCNVAGAPIIDGFPAVTVTATIAAGSVVSHRTLQPMNLFLLCAVLVLTRVVFARGVGCAVRFVQVSGRPAEAARRSGTDFP